MAEPRKAGLSVEYKGSALDSKITSYVTGFDYTDVASGASDAIDITLQNINKNWLNSWMPNKGDSITTKIYTKNWNKAGDSRTFSCGSFIIDDVSFSGRPLSCNIGAVSMPANANFKATTKTKTWTNVTIKEIASQIASEAGIELYYEADSIKISEIEQSNETNSSFLLGICEDYGLAIKIYSSKLVIFNEETYEEKKKTATINESDMLSWSYNTTLDGTYTGVRVRYTNPDTSTTTTFTIGDDTRLLELNSRVDSKYDAELQALAKVNKANAKMTTMSVKIMANTAIIASSVVEITGLGKLNGRYYVDKVKHSLSNGYTMALTLHLIRDRIKMTETYNKAYAATAAKKEVKKVVNNKFNEIMLN